MTWHAIGGNISADRKRMITVYVSAPGVIVRHAVQMILDYDGRHPLKINEEKTWEYDPVPGLYIKAVCSCNEEEAVCSVSETRSSSASS